MAESKSTSNVTTPSEREISMTRIFDAPREVVFNAHIDPKIIPLWWGQRDTTTIVDSMEPRVGGKWRFVQREANGTEYGFRGEFLEIVPHERLVQTFEFEGMPGSIVTDTAVFEDLGGKTRITTNSLFASKEERDGMLSSGMETGANESWDLLAEYLATV